MAPKSSIIQLHSAVHVLEHLEQSPAETIVFLDVDDTLVTPISSSFRVEEGVLNLIDAIKANKAEYPEFESIIGAWRLQRKIQLVDDDWPQIIEQIKSKFAVYGLTKMDTGPFGPIPSIEAWRYEELLSLGLTFSASEAHEALDAAFSKEKNAPVFFKGIFLTGGGSKSGILRKHNQLLKPKKIVLVDDRRAQLEDVQHYCTERGINFLGIHFKALEHLPRYSPELLEFQKHMLVSEKKWLEDQDALLVLRHR